MAAHLSLAELTVRASHGAAPPIEVHALTPMMYVIYAREGDSLLPIGGGDGARRFPSRFAAQQALSEAGIREAVFVHRSAYGEMVGVSGDAHGTELREVLHIPAPS